MDIYISNKYRLSILPELYKNASFQNLKTDIINTINDYLENPKSSNSRIILNEIYIEIAKYLILNRDNFKLATFRIAIDFGWLDSRLTPSSRIYDFIISEIKKKDKINISGFKVYYFSEYITDKTQEESLNIFNRYTLHRENQRAFEGFFPLAVTSDDVILTKRKLVEILNKIQNRDRNLFINKENIPDIIIMPGKGFGYYDDELNIFIIPLRSITNFTDSVFSTITRYRWLKLSNEERSEFILMTDKDYPETEIERISKDKYLNYFFWSYKKYATKEVYGYRILSPEIRDWFELLMIPIPEEVDIELETMPKISDKGVQVNKERLLSLFYEMVKIYSPSLGEEEMIKYIIKKIEKINLNYEKIEYSYNESTSSNIIIRVPSNTGIEAPLLFAAHIDTVEPCKNISPVEENGYILSGGKTILGSDDKAAVAAIIEGLYIITESGIKHNGIEIVFTSAEEVGLIGSKNIDISSLKSKFGFVLDSEGNAGTVTISAPTHKTMEMTFHGKKAHAGIEPEKGLNAVVMSAEFINSIKWGRISEKSTSNIGVIRGGDATNIVPDRCVLRMEVRSHDNDELEKIIYKIRDTAQSIVKKHGGKADTAIRKEYSAFSIEKDDDILKLTQKACNNLDLSFKTIVSGGGSDTNIFNENGIKSINLGIGMEKVHTENERIAISNLINTVKLIISIIDVATRLLEVKNEKI